MANPFYDIVNKYPNEVKESKSTKTKRVIIIKAKDRTGTQDAIEKELTKNKFKFFRKKDAGLSGSTEVTVVDYSSVVTNGSVVLVFKPDAGSGGMTETTLNSTITELAPALAFTEKYKPKNVSDFYNFIKNIDHKKSPVYVVDRDIKAGKDFVDQFPSSSKFEEKMENAMGILKFLYEEDKKNPISNVFWGYRAKPDGVDSKHKGDLFIVYKNKKMLGVSLKAGGEKTSEPKLNTYVKPILEALDLKKIEELKIELWNKTYKSFTKDRFNYDKGTEKKAIIEKLAFLEKNDPKSYNKMYDDNLDIVRKYLNEAIERDVKKTVTYLNKAIANKDEVVPLLVLKAFGSNYKVLTDEDDVSIFLPKVKKVKSYSSTTSKQDFYIELFSSSTDKLLLKFAVRTNKTGDEHKLGQFYNLAVKFNGVK
jgi:hypothetical protein